MKTLFYIILCLFFIAPACSTFPGEVTKTIDDGFYTVVKMGNDTTRFDSIHPCQLVIHFNHSFIENDPGEFTKLLIDTSGYVPLELDVLPATEKDTELKKKLLITLTPAAASKVEAFTAGRIMQQVAIVLNGEAVTVHKIRDTIKGGHIQITRCDDNACEMLYVRLKDHVKK